MARQNHKLVYRFVIGVRVFSGGTRPGDVNVPKIARGCLLINVAGLGDGRSPMVVESKSSFDA